MPYLLPSQVNTPAPRTNPDYYDRNGFPTWTSPGSVPAAGYISDRPAGAPVIGTNAASGTGVPGAGAIPVPNFSNLGNLGGALNTAGQVNQFNLDYVHGALGADPAYQSALRLLNPNDAQANYDVTMHGAEGAVAGGIPGSGLAGETTGRLRQSDIERRAAEGSQLLSQAYGRTPAPFDVSSQLLTPYQSGQLSLQEGQLSLQQAQLALDDKIRSGQLQVSQQDLALRDKIQSGELTLDQAKLALQDKIQSGQLSVENARLLLDWYKARQPQFYGGSGGGSPGGGGAVSPTANVSSGVPAGSRPLSLPRGPSSWEAPPSIVGPDNWADMTPQQQMDYAAQYRANPYNYGAVNPWEADEGNWYGGVPVPEADDSEDYY